MIQWIKYDPANPPKFYKPYLTYNGKEVRSAWIEKPFHAEYPLWYPSNIEELIKGVTHYAHINLPGEEIDNA